MSTYPIVILPGWLLGSKRFDPLAKEFKKKGFDVYCVDFPGFENETPLTNVSYLTDYVVYVRKFLKQKKITKAIFVAHSFGGRVAFKLLSQEPKLAHALIISGTPGFRNRGLRALGSMVLAKVGKVLILIPPFLFFRKRLEKLLYKLGGAHDYSQLDGVMKGTFKNIVSEPLLEYMKKIRLPTLLIWGEKDPLASLKIANRMQKVIKNSQMIVIPQERHNFLYKQPETFVSHVVKFLGTL